MSTCRTIRESIKDVTSYIAKYPVPQQSAALELLFSKAMSLIFHLTFFTSATDNAAVTHKVVWLGKNETNPSNAPASSSDTIIYARHFDVLMEVTQNTGTKQWDREFCRAVRHRDAYIKNFKNEPDDVFLVLIVREINVDTYESIRQKIHEGSHIVLLRFSDIERILQVCDISIGLRHFDLKQLFSTLARDVKDTASLSGYNRKATHTISDWRKAFLKHDQLAYVGIKSYNLVKTMNMNHLTASYIATELYTQKEVKAYFKILDEPLRKEYVSSGMLTFGFACETGIPQLDPILTIVSKMEIEERIKEILANIEKD